MYNKIVNHNALLIRIPRTGTGSMGYMLGVNDGHKTARDLKKEMGTEWGNLFKFAFVRHPYERFKSCWIATGSDKDYGDVNEFFRNRSIQDLMIDHAVFFRPQVDYVLDENGSNMLNYTGRFERLEEGWLYVFSELKIHPDFVHQNKTERPHPPLNEDTKNILYNFYRKDFDFFGYKR